jgi:hypothetical protein
MTKEKRDEREDSVSNHNTYTNKSCATCGYIMRHVSTRRRWCKQCLAVRFAARIVSPIVRAKMRITQEHREYEKLIALVDNELSAPTRYWEIGQ